MSLLLQRGNNEREFLCFVWGKEENLERRNCAHDTTKQFQN